MALPYALGILLYSVAWRSYRYGTGVMIAAICDTLLLPPIFALCTAPRVPMPLLKEDTCAAQEAIDKLLDPELLFGTPSPHGAFSSSSAVQ